MSFSQRLNALKKSQNLLQKDIASAIGIPLRTYQRYEYGEREPSIAVITALANHFDIPADYFLERGVYKNWEEIIEQKTNIIKIIEELYPSFKKYHLNSLDNLHFIRIIPLLFAKIEFNSGKNGEKSITLYPTIAFSIDSDSK